ncbi:hypothetical protein ACWOB1_05175 [Facklamia languida]|uniref:DUF5067 domain-containing protein n=1 Tax=Facklamia languida CCUG 37842 TaxID=883113 RepID=H3NJJ4_9LACT|nr:hypothetical protein [Facklamia languida]EHR36807.1 hypothetical protein HMPREF9708_01033 [Facklamia languida CCUG 37842]
MKKNLLLLATLFTLGGFAPSVSAEDNPNQARIEEIEAQIKELQAELKELKGDEEGENQIVLDNELFKITYKEFKEKDDRLEFIFEVENKTDENYTFQTELISIDGYMVDDTNKSMSDSVAADKKGKIRLTISDHTDEGLPEPTGDLELTLRTFVDGNYSDVMRYPIAVELD